MSRKNSRPYNRKGNRKPSKSWEVFVLRGEKYVHWHTQGGIKGPFSKAMADAFVRNIRSRHDTACVHDIYSGKSVPTVRRAVDYTSV